jgi:transcriptional regulator with XRE-family HTH domain
LRLALTQKEVAARAQVSIGHLGSIERGEFLAKSGTRKRLAEALGLDEDWILFPEEAPRRVSPVEVERPETGQAVVVSFGDESWKVIRSISFLRNCTEEEVVEQEVVERLEALRNDRAVARALEALSIYEAPR